MGNKKKMELGMDLLKGLALTLSVLENEFGMTLEEAKEAVRMSVDTARRTGKGLEMDLIVKRGCEK